MKSHKKGGLHGEDHLAIAVREMLVFWAVMFVCLMGLSVILQLIGVD